MPTDTHTLSRRLSRQVRTALVAASLATPLAAVAYIGEYDGAITVNPVAVKAGDALTFSCYGDDAEGQRIEVGVHPDATGKIDWTLTLNDTIDNRTINVNVRKVERNKYDFDHDESIVISMTVDGKEMFSKDFGRSLSISKSTIFLRLEPDGKRISISAGSRYLEPAGSIDFEGFVDVASVSSRYNITVDRHSALYIPVPNIEQIYPDEQSVTDALARCTDNRCGIWEFFDEDVETDMALKGGRYKLALLPSSAGGYDLIYLSGAEIASHRWSPGALKGRLIPTPFANTYNMYWVDSEGKAIDDMSPYATVEGAIMSLFFPLQKANFRFMKSR